MPRMAVLVGGQQSDVPQIHDEAGGSAFRGERPHDVGFSPQGQAVYQDRCPLDSAVGDDLDAVRHHLPPGQPSVGGLYTGTFGEPRSHPILGQRVSAQRTTT